MKAKRYLALILSLLMIAAMLPSAFAEIGDREAGNGVYPAGQSATGQQGTTPAQNNSGSSSGGHSPSWA